MWLNSQLHFYFLLLFSKKNHKRERNEFIKELNSSMSMLSKCFKCQLEDAIALHGGITGMKNDHLILCIGSRSKAFKVRQTKMPKLYDMND